MTTVILILIWLLQLYAYVLLGRIIIEMIQSFSRNFRPPRWFCLIGEVLFILTDPPVKLLRRLIPPVRMGQVALDLSILVLFFGLQIAQLILHAFIR